MFRSVPFREIFKKGLHSEVVRKWEQWIPHNELTQNRHRIPLDDALEQLLVSVALNYENTNSFLSDSWNILDAVVVMVSIFGISWRFWSTLRALRLFRVVLRRSKIRQILVAIKKCIPSLLCFLLFIILLLFIFSIIGLNLFTSSLDGGAFTNILSALCTISLISRGAEWDDVVTATDTNSKITLSTYFVFVVVIGQYVGMSLFMAIIISNYKLW